jgi:rhodanese-related sulfurtransferase
MDDSTPVPIVDHAELLRALTDPALRLLNVLPHAYFREKRIPGSQNLPYTEIADRSPAMLPDKTVPIIVYCAGPT